VVFQVVHLSFTIKRVFGFRFLVLVRRPAKSEIKFPAKTQRGECSAGGQEGEKQSGKMQGRRDAAEIANRGIGVAVPLGCKYL
jgi:hypothetical protein